VEHSNQWDISKMEDEIKGNLENMGFRVMIPSRRWSSLLGPSEPEPDIVVERGGKRVFIGVKDKPITFSDIRQMHQFTRRGDGAIICTPEEFFPDIPKSVHSYANEVRVVLCNLREVGTVTESVFHSL